MSKEDPGKEVSETVDSTNTDEDESEDLCVGRDSDLYTSLPTSNGRSLCCGRPLWLIIAVLAAVVAVSYPLIQANMLSSEEDHSKSLDHKIKRYIEVWRNGYPNQNIETWGTIAGQLTEFARVGHTSPLVIVMAYAKGHTTTQILASEVSRAALNLVKDSDKCGDTDAAKISGGDLRIQSEFFLSNYTPQIMKCRKMILFDLHKIDGSAAKDLHSMLDPDHPIIPHVVFIFTVKIVNFEGNVYHEVRNTLTTNWSVNMDGDQLNALMSRLVNNVKIIPEPEFE